MDGCKHLHTLEIEGCCQGVETNAGTGESAKGNVRGRAGEDRVIKGFQKAAKSPVTRKPDSNRLLSALFYLGGYCVRSQRDFLKKVRRDNPTLVFWHFGDMDVGGFYIHEHLCRATGIPFRLYRMSRKELEDPRFQSCLRRLTQQDRIRLKSLEKQELYRDLVMYMLEKNIKPEQEIVSFYGTGNESMEEYFI